jgi:hypothetical protein
MQIQPVCQAVTINIPDKSRIAIYHAAVDHAAIFRITRGITSSANNRIELCAAALGIAPKFWSVLTQLTPMRASSATRSATVSTDPNRARRLSTMFW